MNKHIKTEIVIHASKAKVWQILTNFPAYATWNPFILRIEGELRLGARLKNTLRNGDSTMTFKPVITQVTPGKSFSWLGSLFVKGLFDGLHSFTIEDAGNNHVKLIHEESFSGLLSGFIVKKIGAATRNNFIQMNTAIKDLAESA